MHLCSQRQTDRQTDAHTHTDTQSVLWGISLTHTHIHSLSLSLSLCVAFFFCSEVPWLWTRRTSALWVQPADRFPDRDHRGGVGSLETPAVFILLILLLFFSAACYSARCLHTRAVANPDPARAVRRPRVTGMKLGKQMIASDFIHVTKPYRSVLIAYSDPIFVIMSHIRVSHWPVTCHYGGNGPSEAPWNHSHSRLFKINHIFMQPEQQQQQKSESQDRLSFP